jgi:hypothetical protein
VGQDLPQNGEGDCDFEGLATAREVALTPAAGAMYGDITVELPLETKIDLGKTNGGQVNFK